jgi:hypothetical protein
VWSADRLARWLPAALVTAFGLWLLWPVPTGVMPLSADHTVHLTRATLYAEQLAGGHVVGWSPAWFFGFPLGELYPVLGDLGVAAFRALSLGLLDWPTCYALMFTLVFVGQGWAVLRCGRALGWGPAPGLVAALLTLADVGAYREGGWTYTVTYGVWPQALATALAWLAFAELALAPADRPGRHLARAAVAAAAALLAHPMALMMLALGAPLYLLTVGLRGADAPRLARRDLFAATARHLLLALGLGLALAAWWWLPMSAHRGWMASYGWLHAPLADMLRLAGEGQWTQLMPAAVGHSAALGLVLAALVGRGPLRFVALWTAAHWLLASTDAFWELRLDRLSAGFSHIQYQRFLIAAKPGIFLLAGAAVGGLVHLAFRTWPQRHVPSFMAHVHATVPGAPGPDDAAASGPRPRPRARRLAAAALLAAGLALALWQALGVRAAMQRHHVGEVQTARMPGDPAFAADYAAFLAWAAAQWQARDRDYRIAFRADRNAHWFMDSPVVTRTPTYKLGFTPGDNFVHKPESGDPAVLRRLGVRYLAGTSRAAPPGARLAASFGKIHVFELADPEDLAHLERAGDDALVTVEHADLAAGRVRVRVAGAAGDDARLVLHVAGYPRWDLSFRPADDAPAEPVPWVEVPVVGDAPPVDPADRRAGLLRGGKALGDDGREPTLIAAPARDGVYELRYARWRRADVLGLLLALAGLVGVVLLARTRGDPLARLHPPLRRLAHPALVAGALALLVAVAAVRHRRAGAREHDLASARLARGDAAAVRARPGPLKTDMLIFPAVLARPGREDMSEVTFPRVRLGPALDGWFALDDDDAKLRRRGSHRLTIAARPAGGDWTPLAELSVPHRPDRRRLADVAVPPALQDVPVDLRVQVAAEGEHPPRLGFDLVLADAP